MPAAAGWRHDNRIRALVFAGLALLLLHYLRWRVTDTLPPFEWSWSGLWPYLYLAAELAGAAMTLLTYMTFSRISHHSPAVDAWFAAGHRPQGHVALLIPSYNEPAEVLERTIYGALSQDHADLSIWVLDDTRRDWLAELCARCAVHYVRRADNQGAKAGNINHGIRHLRAEGFEPAYFAVLDADFIASPHFVSRCLGLFAVAPEAGLVQTPQQFFNPDPLLMNLALSGLAADEQRLFFEDIMPCKDAWGTAFCCGTSTLLKAEAYDAIGGIPAESVTEDMLTSLRMREQGYATRFLNEPLTTGMAPDGLDEFVLQRHRWALGYMQIFKGIYNPFSLGTRIGLIDRLHLIDTFLFWSFSFLFKYLLLCVPALYWITGLNIMQAELGDILLHLLPWMIGHMLVYVWMTEGRFQVIVSDVFSLLTAPAALHATWTGLFSKQVHKFKVTPKGSVREKALFNWGVFQPIGVLLALNLVALALALMPSWQPELSAESRLLNGFWVMVNLAFLGVATLTCIEIPRPRKQERFAPPAGLRAACAIIDGRPVDAELLDFSMSGCNLRLRAVDAAALAIGRRFPLRLANGLTLAAIIKRQHSDDEGLLLGCAYPDCDLAQKIALIRAIFGDGRASTRYSRRVWPIVGNMLRVALGLRPARVSLSR